MTDFWHLRMGSQLVPNNLSAIQRLQQFCTQTSLLLLNYQSNLAEELVVCCEFVRDCMPLPFAMSLQIMCCKDLFQSASMWLGCCNS